MLYEVITTDEDYKKLGLSEKQINTINNYKNKGGTFKTKEDFKKMYVISDEEYKRLEPYIVIKVHRITSYNVCYTKLLRELFVIAQKTINFLTGFYSDFGLELLSTIDFIVLNYKSFDYTFIDNELKNWSA